MAAEFIGYAILVTLSDPAGTQLEGTVSDVVNSRLYLRNVLFKATGQRLQAYTLDASSIADLEIAPSVPHARILEDRPVDITRDKTNVQTSLPQFSDPAILSYSKNAKPSRTKVAQPQDVSHTNPGSKIDISTIPPLREQTSSLSTRTARNTARKDSSTTATLTEPFDALAIADSQSASNTVTQSFVKSKPEVINHQNDAISPSHSKSSGRGRGWRSTPLTETRPQKARSGRNRKTQQDTNGWATEDVTDIAEMGEFDFAENLSRFDKHKVFEDIRREDTTANEDRLVSFNRIKPRPGTNGGKNLHFTQNVLDGPELDPSRWKSEAGETEDDVLADEYHYSSGKGSKRASSRKPIVARKNSVIPTHLEQEQSPRPLSRMQTASPLNGGAAVGSIFCTASDHRVVHTISPLQMLELEQLCSSEFGLSEDILAENAGRSIAEAMFLHLHTNTASASTEPLESTFPKSVLFLVGNHKTGARALAAARQLRNRRIGVTVCIPGIERGEDQLLEVIRRQLRMYRSSSGYVTNWEDYQSKLSVSESRVDKSTSKYPNYVVDALLSVHLSFDELRTDDQAQIFSMIRWVNLLSKPSHDTASSVLVMSLDVPSGISATTGAVAMVESQPLSVNSSLVVCLGAPKSGLLTGMTEEYSQSISTIASRSVYVADIGLSLGIWQKNSGRKKHVVEFGAEWVVPLEFVRG